MKEMCLTMFFISVILVLFSIELGRLIHQKNLKSRRNILTRRRYILTPFQIFLIGFFIATALLFIPIYYHNYFLMENGFGKLSKVILLSIHNTMRLFILDGDFQIVKDTITKAALGDPLTKVYSLYMAILFVAAPVLTAGFVLSFFKNVASSVRYFFQPKSDIYIMSQLNECSIALARDILTNPDIEGEKLVLFADVFEKEEEENFELVQQAKRLGAICFRKDITELGLRPYKNKIMRKFYFLGDNEDENVKHALKLIARCRQRKCYNTKNTQFYVLSNSIESEALLNSIDNGNMRVRRVRQSRNLALDVLRKYSIFKTDVKRGDKKLINIVIVGLGGYGVELLKSICWCGQMDGYLLQIHVFDREKDCEGKIRGFAPELIKYNHRTIEGEPFYDIYFYDEIDVTKQIFLEKLSAIKDITKVYVTLGDDELNIETAMRMRMQFGRDAICANGSIPPIFTVVYSSLKSETFEQNNGLQSIKGDDYGIQFIGSMGEKYSLRAIEQEELEADGLEVHLFWVKNAPADKVQKSQAAYEKFEYYRRASAAQALHIRFREDLGLLYEDDLEKGKILEHKRWNAYMRAEGYVFGKETNDIAKTHNNLKPYCQLLEHERKKDIVVKLARKPWKNQEE